MLADIALIALVVALAMAIGSIVFLVSRNSSLTDALLSARDNAGTNAIAAERAKFDADKATQALAAERAVADSLQEFIAHDAQSTDALAPLAPGDVAGRVLRITQRWRAANVSQGTGAPGAVPAGAVPPVAPPVASAADVPRPVV